MAASDATRSRGAPIRVRPDPRFAGLVPEYLEAKRGEVSALREALERADYARIGHVGHNLRGTGGGYGFPLLSHIGAALEEAAERGDRAELARGIDALENFLGRIELDLG